MLQKHMPQAEKKKRKMARSLRGQTNCIDIIILLMRKIMHDLGSSQNDVRGRVHDTTPDPAFEPPEGGFLVYGFAVVY